jgi:putative salt-induced outer membrane protein YdiY
MQKSLILIGLLASAPAFAADKEKPFSMDGEFGFISTSGNTETTSIKAKLSAHQELVMWSNDYKVEGLYKKDEVSEVSQTTAQKYFLSGQGNYKLTNPDHRIFGFASYEDDRFSSFDYQSTIAAGWSQKVWQDDASQFNYSIGPGYSFAKRQTGESENGAIVRASMNYQLKISDTAQFKQVVSTEIGSDNTKSKSESSVSAKISDGFSLKVSLVLDHNSDVPDGKENLDTQTAVTLVYTFF